MIAAIENECNDITNR